MSDHPVVGRFRKPSDLFRDAIHIAIAPVVTGCLLKPGQHVGFMPGSTTTVVDFGSAGHIGIIDPFIPEENIEEGQECWLFLYPQSIVSLRHNWEHPAFKEPAGASEADIKFSKQWVKAFSKAIGQTYDELMQHADHHAADYDYINVGNREGYNDVDPSRWPLFWTHWSIISGVPVPERATTDHAFFSCAC